ncbi:Bro-N domain-containing protein [Dichelobacter nodosus]|uniref:BRO-N domain-containing protein n=1 Tax=Dichelobacter nodosus TaxID=870 RepID=UPI0006802291|nr:BRO family protein [Dichelobacter nodosus]
MSNLQAEPLSFNHVIFKPVELNDDQIWLTATQLAQALGYKRVNAVTQVYHRNADEFSENMTQVIDFLENVKLTFSDKTKKNFETVNLTATDKAEYLTNKTRIFSLRGCHLVALFSRTKNAKDFRKWVLDILDREIKTNASITINTEQQRIIQEAVNAKAQRDGVSHHSIYHDLKTRYRIPRYNELPAELFQDCLAWLGGYHIEYKNSNFEYRKERAFAVGIMEHVALAFEEQDEELHDLWTKTTCLCLALRQIEKQAEELRRGLQKTIQGNCAEAHVGLRAAQSYLKFPTEVINEGREAARSCLRRKKMEGEK